MRHEKETESLRLEITERVKLLHQMINLGIVLLFLYIVILIVLVSSGRSWESIRLTLLSMPIVFVFLTLNYQANQMTMEAVARYLGGEWEQYYKKQKRNVRLTSVLKVFPLIFAQVAPLIVLQSIPDLRTMGALFWADLALVCIAMLNFFYKLKQ